jgi:hypothetical protein
MDKQVPEYRAYCDICNNGSPWFVMSVERAKAWRDLHFDDQHPDNPMKKENCRIQRQKKHVEAVVDNPETQARIVDALNHD